jgi:hypothetical protein
LNTIEAVNRVGISERAKEVNRRRRRRRKLMLFKRKLTNANASERASITRKIRMMTPGCNVIISNWELEGSNR